MANLGRNPKCTSSPVMSGAIFWTVILGYKIRRINVKFHFKGKVAMYSKIYPIFWSVLIFKFVLQPADVLPKIRVTVNSMGSHSVGIDSDKLVYFLLSVLAQKTLIFLLGQQNISCKNSFMGEVIEKKAVSFPSLFIFSADQMQQLSLRVCVNKKTNHNFCPPEPWSSGQVSKQATFCNYA